MIYNFFISIYFCFLINFFLICRLNIIIRLDNRFIFCVNSLFLLSFSFTGFYRLIEFKDNLRTIEPRIPKNLRTKEARSDFTSPYKKKCRVGSPKMGQWGKMGLLLKLFIKKNMSCINKRLWSQ